MKEKGASRGGTSPARGSRVVSRKSKAAANRKAPVKAGSAAKLTFSGTVQYFGLGSGSGSPVQLAASELRTAKEPFVSVFRVSDKASLTRSQKLLRQAPHLGHRSLAVVSPKVFNDPDLRPTIIDEYSDVLVEEAGGIALARLVKFLEKSGRSALKELARRRGEPAPEQTLSEAASVDLSARLRDTSGRLDAKKISDLLGIKMTDLATKVCGVTKQALGQSPTSAGIQDKLQPLEDIAQLLHWCGGDEAKLRAWLKRPNPDFPVVDGRTPSPVDLILRGHSGIVARKVYNLRTGHPA